MFCNRKYQNRHWPERQAPSHPPSPPTRQKGLDRSRAKRASHLGLGMLVLLLCYSLKRLPSPTTPEAAASARASVHPARRPQPPYSRAKNTAVLGRIWYASRFVTVSEGEWSGHRPFPPSNDITTLRATRSPKNLDTIQPFPFHSSPHRPSNDS